MLDMNPIKLLSKITSSGTNTVIFEALSATASLISKNSLIAVTALSAVVKSG
jgi:hypothetical protein